MLGESSKRIGPEECGTDYLTCNRRETVSPGAGSKCLVGTDKAIDVFQVEETVLSATSKALEGTSPKPEEEMPGGRPPLLRTLITTV